MRRSRRAKRLLYFKRRFKHHWRTILFCQIAAYFVVLVLWALPIPNPVKMLAVTFHELSHALAALATGGRVFGIAVSPGGGGVTLGLGGNVLVVLFAGHIGSCLWGALLFYLSGKLRPEHCLSLLTVIVMGTCAVGWLNNATILMGVLTMAIMAVLFKTPRVVKLFFIQLVACACCLYAPIDVLGEVLGKSTALGIGSAEAATKSDIHRIAELLSVHPVAIGAFFIAVQVAVMVFFIRWTASAGAKHAVKEEIEDHRQQVQVWRDIHPDKRRHVVK
ncbi:MAG TPA: hypothetical protein HPP83_09815 [Candidatus Hydrogenedentes bacterium]|nr:hypothetical protein [Candidatus Hydrogenedentota bacterium]